MKERLTDEKCRGEQTSFLDDVILRISVEDGLRKNSRLSFAGKRFCHVNSS